MNDATAPKKKQRSKNYKNNKNNFTKTHEGKNNFTGENFPFTRTRVVTTVGFDLAVMEQIKRHAARQSTNQRKPVGISGILLQAMMLFIEKHGFIE